MSIEGEDEVVTELFIVAPASLWQGVIPDVQILGSVSTLRFARNDEICESMLARHYYS
jgi:hypothetical protein